MPDENGFDREEALFLSIMYSFHAAAMQQMGKIANPLTGKVERDLGAARGTIDVLVVFQKKTEGNLSDREKRVLTNLITELQLNFADESGRGDAPPEGEPKEETPTGEKAAAPAEETNAEGAPEETTPPEADGGGVSPGGGGGCSEDGKKEGKSERGERKGD